MNIEMLFYIVMAILLGMRQLKNILWIGGVACIFLGIAALYVDQIGWLKEIFMKVPLLYHFPLFFAGIIFYSMYRGESSGGKLFVGLALAFSAQMALCPHTWRACKHMSQVEYFIVLTVFFLTFYAFTRGKLQFICNRITLFLGKISYPLYLTHQYLSINLLIPYFMWKQNLSLPQAALGVALPAVILVATLIHYAVEVPGTRLFKKVLTPKN